MPLWVTLTISPLFMQPTMKRKNKFFMITFILVFKEKTVEFKRTLINVCYHLVLKLNFLKKKIPVLHKHMHTQAHIVISYIYITVT